MENICLRGKKFQFSKCNIKYNIHTVWRDGALLEIVKKFKNTEINIFLKRCVHIYKNINEIIFNSNIRNGL